MNDLIRQIGVIIVYIIIFAWIGVVSKNVTVKLDNEKRVGYWEFCKLKNSTKFEIKLKKYNTKSGLPVSTGLNYVPIHRCYPATDQYCSFCLLTFVPGPVRC